MNYQRIKKLQKEYGIDEMQNLIDTGEAWKREGFVGRSAMASLEDGACFLPKERILDYYGSTVPSRDDLEPGTKGTFKNSVEFWTKVEDGEIDLAPVMEEEFPDEEIKERLEYLREQIEKECISYGEIAELVDLAEHIDEGDVLLREWAGIEEESSGPVGKLLHGK
jgi:hypothetical protein